MSNTRPDDAELAIAVSNHKKLIAEAYAHPHSKPAKIGRHHSTIFKPVAQPVNLEKIETTSKLHGPATEDSQTKKSGCFGCRKK